MTGSLKTSLYFLAGTIILCFLAGLITRNYSHVDRLWSILPPVYAIAWLFESSNPRAVISVILVTLWGIRLTFNFARRGGYAFNWKKGFTGEDYRWEILRKKIPGRFLFEAFNLFFISGFQLALIFAFSLPLYYVSQSSRPLNTLDFVLFGMHLLFLAGETIADNQQYEFQSRKQKSSDPRYKIGFNTFGLWKFSRHPNYVFEMLQWVVVWLVCVNATESIHPSGAGTAVLVMLFAGSTVMTESITRKKYPEFENWIKATAAWVPVSGFLTGFRLQKQYLSGLDLKKNPKTKF